MKVYRFEKVLSIILGTLLLMLPSMAPAQNIPGEPGLPPVEQQLVREGDLALRLIGVLGVGDVTSEVEAESGLAAMGIEPENGWIADYPVTPDIAANLRLDVAEAADKGRLSMDKDILLKEFDEMLAELGLPLTSFPDDALSAANPPPMAENVSDAPIMVEPEVVNNYYYNEGPPVVTYYPPPPDYTYLYWWVPYPFWYSTHYFHGFFILHDFHRRVFRHHHGNHFFVSNHFRDLRSHRVFRVKHHNARRAEFFHRNHWDRRSPAFGRDPTWRDRRQFSDRGLSGSSRQDLEQTRQTQPRRVFDRRSGGGLRTERGRGPQLRGNEALTPATSNGRSFDQRPTRSERRSGGNLRQGSPRSIDPSPVRQRVNRPSSARGDREFSSPRARGFSRSAAPAPRREMRRSFERSRGSGSSSGRSFTGGSGRSGGRDVSTFRGRSGGNRDSSFRRGISSSGSGSGRRGSLERSSGGGGRFSAGGRGGGGRGGGGRGRR